MTYRDRSEDEIRDIAILRLNQEQWAEPNLLGNDRWQIPGCPVNGPGIDSYDQTIGIAWFSAANDEPKVQVAFSNDEGASFESPMRIDTGNATGRVDIVMLNDSEAVVSWMEPIGQDELIRIRRVSSNGAADRPLTIAKTTAARASGFPQMELLDDRLYVVWTLSNEGQTEIRMASISLSSF